MFLCCVCVWKILWWLESLGFGDTFSCLTGGVSPGRWRWYCFAASHFCADLWLVSFVQRCRARFTAWWRHRCVVLAMRDPAWTGVQELHRSDTAAQPRVTATTVTRRITSCAGWNHHQPASSRVTEERTCQCDTGHLSTLAISMSGHKACVGNV